MNHNTLKAHVYIFEWRNKIKFYYKNTIIDMRGKSFCL